MNKAKITMVLLGMLLTVPAIYAAVPRTEYEPYNVGVGLNAACPTPGAVPVSAGGVCFMLDGSETSATITIHDSTMAFGVPGLWALRDAADALIADDSFCDSDVVPIPLGTAGGALRVWVGGPGAFCFPGAATTGLVQADFS